tara:strand:- start:402 stop:674 length:273 start_codon:yes stop_codon:yes gene_type:complete
MNSKNKITCIIDNLASGGAQRQITHLIKGLKKKGYNIELYLFRPGTGSFFQSEIEAVNVVINEAQTLRFIPSKLGTIWHLYFFYVREKVS